MTPGRPLQPPPSRPLRPGPSTTHQLVLTGRPTNPARYHPSTFRQERPVPTLQLLHSSTTSTSFITPAQRSEGVPWPELRNPDPVAVYQSAANFQNWMSANNPTPTLVEAYTAPWSPERGFDLELFAYR